MSFRASLAAASELAALADRLALLRLTTDREADELRARWAANSAEYFRRKDQEQAR